MHKNKLIFYIGYVFGDYALLWHRMYYYAIKRNLANYDV